MKTTLTFFVLSLFVINAAFARIWRVNKLSNYNGTSLFGSNLGGNLDYPVFSELSQPNSLAMVQRGDTIHLEGAVDIYATTLLTKKLVIIGPGYFLTENPNVSPNYLQAKINYLQLMPGSDSSQLIGISFVTNQQNPRLGQANMGVTDIAIKRCWIEHAALIAAGCEDIVMTQNFFANTSNNNSAVYSILQLNANGFPADFTFSNNICKGAFRLTANNGSIIYSATQCNNNVFDFPAGVVGSAIQFNAAECANNIIRSANCVVSVGGDLSNFTNNISAETSQLLGSSINNFQAVNIASLFVSSVSSDAKYQINTSSPDYHVGSDGTEPGAFGGTAITRRYTLSGLAQIPVIYQISTSGISDASGLPVIIKARTIQ